MTRELIVHIGSHKTGTTTLQRTFMVNKARLLKRHGIAYVHAPKSEHMHDYMGFDPKQGMVPRGFRITGLDAMAAQLTASTAAVTLMSSENFSFIFDETEIQKLRDKVAAHFDKIRIVAYLRRQDSHMVSHHQEGAKPYRLAEEMLWGSEPRALPTYRRAFDQYLDYAHRLAKWRRVFGSLAVVARVFERSQLKDGDIVSDFLGLLGLPADALDRIEDQNTASGFSRAKVGHMINRTVEVEELKALLMRRLPDEGRMLPSRAEALAFYANYKDSNRRLAEMFGLTARPEVFDQDFSGYPEIATDLWTEESANAAVQSLLGSVEFLLQGITTNDLRDAAFSVESANPALAKKLMLAAHRLRPSGALIREKLRGYGMTP